MLVKTKSLVLLVMVAASIMFLPAFGQMSVTNPQGNQTTHGATTTFMYSPKNLPQQSNEIDIAPGAGSSAQTACVAANNCFTPNPLTVTPGTTVTWKNTDTAIHYVCSGKPTDDQCGKVFEGDGIKPGKTFQFTFTNPGTYDCYCSVHPWMTGQVIVGASSTLNTTTPSQTSNVVTTVTVSADRQSYSYGDIITVSGMVSSVTAGTPLTIQIFDPSNNPVSIVQINVSQDGKYTGTIKATGALWKLNGKYTVKVQYGPPNVTAQATFNFHTPVFTSNVFQLKDPNSQQTFNVNYTISGGSVKTMTIDAQSLSVIVSVNSTNDGSISLQLPRALIDAKTSSGQDDAFVVLIDGAQVIPQISISDLNYRTLTIQFLQGDKKIDIIGTQISGNNQVNTRTNVVTTVTVSADRQSYSYGDIITVSGMVSSVTAGTPLTIQIFDPSNNLVKAYQTDVSQNGMYADSIRITGALWKSIGTYTIKVQYGPPNITAQTTFNFISGSIGTSGPNEIDIAQGAGTSVQTACVATNSCFMPNTLYVSLGTTVTWKNTDTAMHTICSGKATDDQCGKVFEDDTLKPGQIFQYTFANAGTFEYLCSIHPWMIGQVVVGASSPSQLSVQKQYQSCPDCPTSSSTTRQAPPTTITVATDKQVYDHNSKIIITGHVSNPYTGQIVQVKITSTSGNMVSGKIVSLDNDGNYITILSTTGNLWFENGQYKLAVQYNDGQSVTNSTYFQLAGPAPEIAPVNTPVITPTQQDVDNINKARSNQTIAAEINVGNDKTDTKSIDSSVQVQTTSNTPDSLGVKVSAANQTGPKVIVFNINATTINVKNLKDLGVMYDGKPITPAQNMDSILHAKSTDEPSFAIIVTQSGVQVLVLIPHFSTHTITITNMTQVIPAVPEFGPVAGLVVVVSMILCVVASKRFYITC